MNDLDWQHSRKTSRLCLQTKSRQQTHSTTGFVALHHISGELLIYLPHKSSTRFAVDCHGVWAVENLVKISTT
jgi:hypothetical protein